MTKRTQDYISGGQRCPFCGGNDPWKDELGGEFPDLTVYLWCPDCHKEWAETYAMRQVRFGPQADADGNEIPWEEV